MAFFNITQALIDNDDFSRQKIHKFIVGAIYVCLILYMPVLIKKLFLIDKNILIASSFSLLILLVLDKLIQSCAESVNESCFRILKFIKVKFGNLFNGISDNDLIQIPTQKLNAEDLRVSAVHEAGHALLYGILDYFPESIYAYISKKSHSAAELGAVIVGGQVGVHQEIRSHHYQSFIEWDMLFTLAGQEGEKALNGQSSMGATSDIEEWYRLAKYYLSSGCSKLLYFPSPETNWETQSNQKSIEIMIDKQRKILSRFFKENQLLLEELAELLTERERLSAVELKPILQKVVRTPGLPIVLKKYSPHI